MHKTKKKGVFEHNVTLKAQISMNVHKDKKKKKKNSFSAPLASQNIPFLLFPLFGDAKYDASRSLLLSCC